MFLYCCEEAINVPVAEQCYVTPPLQVPLFVNKVGPYYNPHETYSYYMLPVCRPQEVCVCVCGGGRRVSLACQPFPLHVTAIAPPAIIQ